MVLVGADGRRYTIDRPRTAIGRSRDNHIVLTDPSVSREHAAIARDGREFFLVDLGSLNGTYVNGVRLVAFYRLRPGDRLRLGNTILNVRDETAPPDRPRRRVMTTRRRAVALEAGLGLVGLLGAGWLYAGETATAFILLLCNLLFLLGGYGSAILTHGLLLVCVLPVQLGLIVASAVLLHRFLRRPGW